MVAQRTIAFRQPAGKRQLPKRRYSHNIAPGPNKPRGTFFRKSMVCPVCSAAACRRSRRRTFLDFWARLVWKLPWRCTACGTRFRARNVPVKDLVTAHCSICGNHELKRIAGAHVNGFLAPLWRALGVPAFRCVPCRFKFFSLRPQRKETEEERLKVAS